MIRRSCLFAGLIFAGLIAGLIAGLALALAGIAAADPSYWRLSWPRTDFTNSSVAFGDILFAGPGRDGIAAVDRPRFIPVAEEYEIDGREPVLVLEIEGAAPRAYPVRYLLVHEIVNDMVGDLPVVVTYCPLCNSALAFDRRLTVEGAAVTLDFGVTGMLRHQDMVMYDRQTESWWQQALGQAILGELNGRVLSGVPGWTESWQAFRARNPDGLVMAPPRGRGRYGITPYVGYDSAQVPFGFGGDLPDNGVPALARVVRVGDRAWPLVRLRAAGGELVEDGLRITWSAGQASAVDTFAVAEGRDVGSIRVFDAATGAPLVHDVLFAFAFHNLWPQGRWMLGRRPDGPGRLANGSGADKWQRQR